MPAKAPIYLKPVNSKKGKKCRLRDMLSPDMISPPLGDFRHTVHIGRGGDRDTFGDMSFLQGKFELLPGKKDIAKVVQAAPTFGGGLQNDYLRTHSTSEASTGSFAETPSPVLKNAISLPTIGGGQALTLPLISCGGGGGSLFPQPFPEPLDDIVGGASSPSSASTTTTSRPDRELEILQMDELLRSMEVFSRQPSSSSPPIGSGVRSKPDVLLDLAPEEEEEKLEEEEEPQMISKAVSKANKANKKPSSSSSSYYISGGSNKSSFKKANGSLYSSASSDSYDSYDGGAKLGHGESPSSGFGHFNGDLVALGYDDKELDCVIAVGGGGGCWADRDSGVEDGGVGVGGMRSGRSIICDDFDLEEEFPSPSNKGVVKRSASRDSLAQITGSLLSLELDLGPSILDDVLGIMNQTPAAKSRP